MLNIDFRDEISFWGVRLIGGVIQFFQKLYLKEKEEIH